MFGPISESRLTTSFARVNDWLRFAELKNGALATLNGAAIVSIHQLADWHTPVPWGAWWWMWWATLAFACSIVISLGSFYARIEPKGFELPRVVGPTQANAVFFGHLADMRRDEVLARLVKGYSAGQPDRYLEDLADQIVINAKNARNKFAFFNLALMATMWGTMTPVGWLLFHWRFCDAKL